MEGAYLRRRRRETRELAFAFALAQHKPDEIDKTFPDITDPAGAPAPVERWWDDTPA